MTEDSQVELIPQDELHFDRINPRLAEFGILSSTSDDEILEILWEAMDVRELVQSIAASGFFKHEPLIVAEESGKHIVIEGNRRLAAVKVLLSGKAPVASEWRPPVLTSAEARKLQILPAIVSTRKTSWRYLGFKHVNGPAKWGSYAKAKYIAEVHLKYKVSLAQIADQIGDRHNTVQRLYRGLMVLDQAERMKVYDPDDRSRTRLAFSHLYTGLDYDGIASFIAIKPVEADTTNPVPENKLPQLRELCVWLYGSKKEDRQPVVQTQNPDLGRLNKVLMNRQALASLRAGGELPAAFEISRPVDEVFEEALYSAKRELTTVRAHLSTGYNNSEELLRVAGSIANMADDIYAEMDRKQSPVAKKTRKAER